MEFCFFKKIVSSATVLLDPSPAVGAAEEIFSSASGAEFSEIYCSSQSKKFVCFFKKEFDELFIHLRCNAS